MTPEVAALFAARSVGEALRGLTPVFSARVLAEALAQVVLRAPPDARAEVLALTLEIARRRVAEAER